MGPVAIIVLLWIGWGVWLFATKEGNEHTRARKEFLRRYGPSTKQNKKKEPLDITDDGIRRFIEHLGEMNKNEIKDFIKYSNATLDDVEGWHMAAQAMRKKQEESEQAEREGRKRAEREGRKRAEREAEANAATRLVKDREYYGSILGLSGEVTFDDIQEAYRKAAAQNHPDKVQHLAPEFSELAESKMKEINDAMEYFKKHR